MVDWGAGRTAAQIPTPAYLFMCQEGAENDAKPESVLRDLLRGIVRENDLVRSSDIQALKKW